MRADDPRHGSHRGYKAHMREDRQPCDACLAANAYYHRHLVYDLQRGRRRMRPAIGARRRLQALQRLGWSQRALSREAGLGGQTETFRYVLNDETDVITRATYNRIVALYERLSMRLPEPSSGAVRARLAAERKGYAPPLAWNDEDLDDPNATPHAGSEWRTTHTRRALIAEVEHLRSLGVSEHVIAQQLNVTPEAIERAEMRANRRAS